MSKPLKELSLSRTIELAKDGVEAAAKAAAEATRYAEQAARILATAMEIVERDFKSNAGAAAATGKAKSVRTSAFKDLNGAAAAAAVPKAESDEKVTDTITLFGQKITLNKPQAMPSSDLDALKNAICELFSSLLDLICKDRADECAADSMEQDTADLLEWLNLLEERAAEEAADNDDDVDPGDDLSDALSEETKEQFAIASQLCDRATDVLREKGFTRLPSVHYLWALFESEFGMVLEPDHVELEWASVNEKKVKFDKLLADPKSDNLEEDFPGVKAEQERQSKRKAKADAKRSEDDKPSKRAKRG